MGKNFWENNWHLMVELCHDPQNRHPRWWCHGHQTSGSWSRSKGWVATCANIIERIITYYYYNLPIVSYNIIIIPIIVIIIPITDYWLSGLQLGLLSIAWYQFGVCLNMGILRFYMILSTHYLGQMMINMELIKPEILGDPIFKCHIKYLPWLEICHFLQYHFHPAVNWRGQRWQLCDPALLSQPGPPMGAKKGLRGLHRMFGEMPWILVQL